MSAGNISKLMSMDAIKEHAYRTFEKEHAAALSRRPTFGDVAQLKAQKDGAALDAFFALPVCAGCRGTGGTFNFDTGEASCECYGTGRQAAAYDKWERQYPFDIWRFLP